MKALVSFLNQSEDSQAESLQISLMLESPTGETLVISYCDALVTVDTELLLVSVADDD